MEYVRSNEWYYSKGAGKNFPKMGMSKLEITEHDALLRVGIPVDDEGRKELKRLSDIHGCHYRGITTKTGPHVFFVKEEIEELKRIVAINNERRAIKRLR